jgi:hypothetical protein
MAEEFINLGNLIPGERYSFTTQLFPGGRVQGIFVRIVENHVEDDRYFFSNVVTPNGPAGNFTFDNPYGYPRNIIHLPLDGAPPTLTPQPLGPDEGDVPPKPPSRGGKSRKTKRRSRKSKRTRKSKKRR